MPRLPNFFIVGAPKAGTTSLYWYLDQHPQVYMSPIKEPNFFASEIRERNFDPKLRRSLRKSLSGPAGEKRPFDIVADWEDYIRLFANAAEESALGEASVCYLWSPTAPERIAERIPHAKIIAMLRDPAERAFSQYLHGLGSGVIRCTFREYIQRSLHRRSELISVHYPFLEFGLYSNQLSRYLERFGRNVWIGFHEDFKSRPLDVLNDICRFLEVADEFSPNMDRQHREAQVPRLSSIGLLKRSGLWRAAANITPSRLRPHIRRALTRGPGTTRMDPADRRYLVDFYREDIGKLARIVARDLDAWLLVA
jgi:Sulfotransferase family